MTQSSDAYAVANGSGATVRAAINADLQALNSNNSGSSGPGSTVAGMWWVDTTTGLVKQRDATNASWIQRFKLNGDAQVDVASASTTDIWTDGAANRRITGTTGITAFSNTGISGQLVWVLFGGILTLTQNATSLILPGGANITTAAGDTMLVENLGSGNARVLTYNKASGQAVVVAPVSGSTAQVVNTETGAVATGTTTIPNDDTIPQNTEGDQYMSLAITPKNAGSTLIIDVVWTGSNGGVGTGNLIAAALFQDSTANALAAMQNGADASGSPCLIFFRHKMTAGGTSATTFKVRAGANVAGTTTFNGVAGGRLLGGVMASSITITEILP